jgi:hypothetical protein
MTRALGIVLAAAATAWASTASAATLSVTITGLSDTGYELNVSGILKNGRLGASAGPATVRDLVDVGARDLVKAVLTFTGQSGVIATCPALEIKLDHSQAACEPTFVLTGRQTGTASFACEAKCQPAKRKQKSSDEDEDDEDDWVYALASPATPAAPRLDGWAQGRGDNHYSQSFYTRAMSGVRERGVYSPPRMAE